MPTPDQHPAADPARSKNRIKNILKSLITVALLLWIGSKLDFDALSVHARQIHLGTYLAGCALMLLPILFTSARWHLLLRSQDIHLPLRYVLGLGISSQFFNAFLPGTTGGDALRAYHAFQSHPNEKTRIITSLIFDRLLGVLAFCAIATAMLLINLDTLPAELRSLQTMTESIALVLVGITIATGIYFCWPGHLSFRQARERMHAWTQKGVFGKLMLFVISQRKHPATFGLAVGATLASCVFLFLSASLIAQSIQLNMSYALAALVMSVVAMTTAIPVSIGGHGVREITLISLFAPLGIVAAGDLESPVLFSLLLVSLQWIWGLVGGLWYLLLLPGQMGSSTAIDR